MKKKTIITPLAAVALAFALGGCGSAAGEETASEVTETAKTDDTENAATETAAPAEAQGSSSQSEAVTNGADGDVYADIDVRDYGLITVKLAPETAPITVANFIKLSESGFYNGLTFHRIMDGFMIQGGDPLGNGTGGSDENIVGEFLINGYNNDISHVRGVISMARAADPDSASSQFFIVQSDSTFLDGQYAGFGAVTDGMDIVDRICADSTPIDSNGTIVPEEQPVINSITIRYEN